MGRNLNLVALALFTWGVGEGMFLYFEPLYLEQLGASIITIGSILGGVGVAMAISYLPAGYLSDRFGRRPLLRLAWLIGLASTLLMALADSLPLFVAGMALYGFTSFVVVPLNSYVTHASGRWSLARTLTLVSATFNAGVIIGPLIGGWIGDQYGLKRTFLVASSLFLLSTILIFNLEAQPVEPSHHLQRGDKSKIFLNGRYIRYIILIFFVMFALYLPQPLSQNFLTNERSLNLAQIGQLISIRSLGIVVLNLVLGQLNARFGFILAQVGMALFTIFLWLGSGLPWYMAGYFLLGGYLTARVLAIAQGRTLLSTSVMGIGYGIMETAISAAIILAPPIAGALYELNPLNIYRVGFFLIIISILISIFLSPIKSKDLQLLPNQPELSAVTTPLIQVEEAE